MSKSGLSKKIITRAGDLLFLGLYRSILRSSPESMMKRAGTLARLYYLLDRRRIRTARRNLALAFGDSLDSRERESIIRESIENFLYEAQMFFWVGEKGSGAIDVEVRGEEYLKEAAARGRGVIVLTAHFGNWEFLGRTINDIGCKLTVIARNSDGAEISSVTARIRRSGGYKVLDRNAPLTETIRVLRRGEVLGILPDQHFYGGINSMFFGAPALTSVGTAAFSLKTGAPIVPGFCIRTGPDTYAVEFYPPLEFAPTGDEDADRQQYTQMVNDAIEAEIRRYPAGWLWIHDRWKQD
ncbi:MAG: lysophospholipid acyltransferase family protein [Abditibacteriota bacterium]|nr:lysophospholipid acyltransferase family protein [Abditibacteriota bacterium]